MAKLSDKQKKATQHPDKLGAGAAKRKKLTGKAKVPVVMHEWKAGTLHSGSGKKVPKEKEGQAQAIAISMSEAGLSNKKMKKTEYRKEVQPTGAVHLDYGKEPLDKEKLKKSAIEAAWSLLKAKIENATSFVDMTTVDDGSDKQQEGKAAEAGLTENDVDPDQLAMGIEVEKEHTSDEEEAKKIALDHLAEFPDYYTHLKEMEDGLENNEGGTPAEEGQPADEEAAPGEDEEDSGYEEDPEKLKNLFSNKDYFDNVSDVWKERGITGEEDDEQEPEGEQGPEATGAATDEVSEKGQPTEGEEAPADSSTTEEAPEEDIEIQLKRKELEHMEQKNKIELDFLKQKRQLELDAMKKKLKEKTK